MSPINLKRTPITEALIFGKDEDKRMSVGELNTQLDELYALANQGFTAPSVVGVAAEGEPFVVHGDAIPDTLSGAALHRDLTGVDLHVPAAHASTHEQGQPDALSVGTPNPIGAVNGAGSSNIYPRLDHDHGIEETGGPTPLTIGAIADGSLVERNGSVLQGVTKSLASRWCDTVFSAGDFALVTGPQTDFVIANYGFMGSAFYPDAIFDEWRFYRTRGGAAGSIVLELYDATNSNVMSTVTLSAAAGPTWEISASAMTNIPVGFANIQLRTTIASGPTLTVHTHYWTRYDIT